MIQIADVLSAAELDALREVLGGNGVFGDGAATAGWHARQRKRNLQADREAPGVAGALRKVERVLLDNTLFQAFARPKALVSVMFSRYEPGMTYGAHVDDALMGGRRTDLSFTLFLSDPDTYDGGALVIDRSEGERAFRLPAGHLVLYPTTALHRVEPVTRGARLAAVGWVRSLIRDEAARTVLFDIDRVIALLGEEGGREQAMELVLKTRSNLMRRWVED